MHCGLRWDRTREDPPHRAMNHAITLTSTSDAFESQKTLFTAIYSTPRRT